MKFTAGFVLGALTLTLSTISSTAFANDVEEGKDIAFDRKKGNCLACHAIEDGTLAGNGGPPLLQMKVRFPEKSDLRAQIWDSTEKNPDSLMPPFGRHGILSDQEIDKIVEYLYTL